MGTEANSQEVPRGNVIDQPTLTLEGAKRIAAAAIVYARDHGAPGGSIAIVDVGGHTLYLERLDGTFAAAADVSIGKARTAVNFRKATKALEDAINKGRPALLPVGEVTWFTPLQGGVPIIVNGHVVGGIGVSGALSQQQDEEIAMAGVQALVSPTKATP
jgi:glc operon protein GlcG